MTRKRPPLAVGELWYVRLPHAVAVVTAEVLELSQKTARLRIHTLYPTEARYELAEVRFIERLPHARNQAAQP